jgi:hypothetical protein
VVRREGFGHTLPATLQVIQRTCQRKAHVEALDVTPAFQVAMGLQGEVEEFVLDARIGYGSGGSEIICFHCVMI